MEIIPNWHPFLVHFTVALPITAAGLFVASHFLRVKPAGAHLAIAGRWALWIGAVSAVLSVAAGFQAYYSVAHDAPSHAAMTVHLKWALSALALLLVAAALAWKDRARAAGTSAALGTVLAVSVGALGATGYLGAENVYRYGLGVMSLPKAEGPGHAHSHGEGEAHDEAPAAAAGEAPEHEHAAGEEHDAPAPAKDEHAHEAAAMESHDGGGHSHDAATLSHTASAPAATVDAFFAALKAGDFAKAESLLDSNVRIFEAGGAERSAQEYASHHMKGDAAFLKAATQEVSQRTGDAVGDLAWVASEQRITGESKGKPVDILSTETMVLRKSPEGWRIVHIHWSSRPFKKE